MKADLLKAIQAKIDSFDDQDTHSIIYWGKFLDFVEEFKPKGKTIEERKKSFYNEVVAFKHAYTSDLLRAFYEHWTECSPNTIALPFEKARTKKAFDVNLRLKRWYKNGKKYEEQEGERFTPNTDTHNM